MQNSHCLLGLVWWITLHRGPLTTEPALCQGKYFCFCKAISSRRAGGTSGCNFVIPFVLATTYSSVKKRVNCVNFQICDKCACKVGLQDFMYKHGPNMLMNLSSHTDTFLDHPDSQDYLDTFIIHPDTFRITQKHSF